MKQNKNSNLKKTDKKNEKPSNIIEDKYYLIFIIRLKIQKC